MVDPAVNEINEHGEDGGFFVAYEGLREGKAFTKIKFTLCKTAEREDRDATLQGKAKRARSFNAPPSADDRAEYAPDDLILDQVRELAPGWDRQALLAKYREWCKGKEPAANPHGAFLGWVKQFAKKKSPP